MTASSDSSSKDNINANRRFWKFFEAKETIGRGTFETLKRGIEKVNGKEFAVKVIDKSLMSNPRHKHDRK